MNIVPALGVLGLLFAAYLAAKVSRQEPGTDRMKEISSAISEGARAFLFSEYKILVIFVGRALCADRYRHRELGNSRLLCGGSFIFHTGRILRNDRCHQSKCADCRNAARLQGMNKALSIAFSGGAVMGMCVAGFGVLGVSGVYLLTGNVDVLSGFSLGASSIALFARVGGGIYTKAADVGADLVGKVEAGIPGGRSEKPGCYC